MSKVCGQKKPREASARIKSDVIEKKENVSEYRLTSPVIQRRLQFTEMVTENERIEITGRKNGNKIILSDGDLNCCEEKCPWK